MRKILLAGAIAILAVPAAISAQTPGTPPADPTGSNTAGANAPPPMPPSPNGGMAPADPSMQPSQPATSAPQGDPVASAGTATDASPPADAANKTYPVCSRTVHDECRNRGGK